MRRWQCRIVDQMSKLEEMIPLFPIYESERNDSECCCMAAYEAQRMVKFPLIWGQVTPAPLAN